MDYRIVPWDRALVHAGLEVPHLANHILHTLVCNATRPVPCGLLCACVLCQPVPYCAYQSVYLSQRIARALVERLYSSNLGMRPTPAGSE